MVGHHVSFLEAHVLQAERDHGAFLQVLRRWLGPTGLSSFKNVSTSPAPTSSQTPGWGEELRKQKVKGRGSLLQTGSGVWLAEGGLAQVAGVSPSLPQPFLL